MGGFKIIFIQYFSIDTSSLRQDMTHSVKPEEETHNTHKNSNHGQRMLESARYPNRSDTSLLRLYLRHRHSQDSVLQRSLHLVHLHVLRQPKLPRELSVRN